MRGEGGGGKWRTGEGWESEREIEGIQVSCEHFGGGRGRTGEGWGSEREIEGIQVSCEHFPPFFCGDGGAGGMAGQGSARGEVSRGVGAIIFQT